MIDQRLCSVDGRRLRIAMLAPFAVYGPKGTTRWRVLPLARALARRGHAVRVVVPSYDCPAEADRCWLDGGVEVVAVPLARGAEAGALTVVARLVGCAVAWQPDIVHSFKPKGYTGLAAEWLARRGLIVVQDCDDWEAGWNVRAGYPRGWQHLFAWQERHGLRDAASVTVASRWLQRMATRLRQCSVGVFYLPNGVETTSIGWGSHSRNTILSNSSQRTADPKRILLYTRFIETGPADVWSVWSLVVAQHPDASLSVIGRGAAGEEDALYALAAAAGAARSVVLLGWQRPETLPGLLPAMRAAVFPVADTPLNRAKSPMRLLDVMAAGVPVAAHAVGEYGEYVQDGENGLLAAPGDQARLASALVRLLDSPDLASRLGDAAARRTAADHSWSRLAETALMAYEAALESAR